MSGGNQQKVIVAKVLNSDLKVVILDEPTKGVDVGAKAQIYEIMSELADKVSENNDFFGNAGSIGYGRYNPCYERGQSI